MRARAVFKELGLAHPTEAPIEAIAWERGVLVRYARIDGAAGRLLRVGARAIATVQEARELGRRRFTVAHELGHFELHDGATQAESCGEQDLNRWSDGRPAETEANVFAAEFLMPEHLFAPRCDVAQVDFRIVEALAADFHVSLTAAAIRFVTFCPERCCVVLARAGTVRMVWTSAEFYHRIERGLVLDSGAIAADHFAGRGVLDRPQLVSADAWLNGRRVPDDAELLEHARALPAYNSVLSLLWIKPDANW